MLHNLVIENFFAFNKKVTIDNSILNLGDDISQSMGVPLDSKGLCYAPYIVGIFGENGTGKTSVLKAIEFMTWFLSARPRPNDLTELPYSRFWGRLSDRLPTTLSMEFMAPEDLLAPEGGQKCSYRYKLSLMTTITGDDLVCDEVLEYKPTGSSSYRRLFERDAHCRVKLAGPLSLNNNESSLSDEMLCDESVLATLMHRKIPAALTLIDFISRMLVVSSISSRATDPAMIEQTYLDRPGLVYALNLHWDKLKLGPFTAEVVQQKNGGQRLTFRHKGIDRRMLVENQSQGTRRFLELFPTIHSALEIGGVALIDDLDASISPAILGEILSWFRDPEINTRGAQLWFTGQTPHAREMLDDVEILKCSRNPVHGHRVSRILVW